MLHVYINYPIGKVSVHHDPSCAHIMKHKKPSRRITINRHNAETELEAFWKQEYHFSSTSPINDMWLVIDLNSVHEEELLVQKIKSIIGTYYSRIGKASIKYHCPGHHSVIPDTSIDPPVPTPPDKVIDHTPIRARQNTIELICETIRTRIADINALYRSGPSLYFYQRTLSLRRESKCIGDFLSGDYHTELLYALLVSWDMDSRNAKLKDYPEFRSALISCIPDFTCIETASDNFDPAKPDNMIDCIKTAYSKLSLMKTNRKLVSNSKCLHFLFPDICTPMDGRNTLTYLYGNNNESPQRYVDVQRLLFEVMSRGTGFEKLIDRKWNQSVPKMFDNAILLLNKKSLNRT